MSGRVAFSRLLIALSIWPTFMGWLFLWSGIGVIFIALGLVMLASAVVMAWSWRTLVLAVVALIVGTIPMLYLFIDIALWKYT